MIEWAWNRLLKLKAQLLDYIGRFLQLDNRLVKMQERADYLENKANRTGDSALESQVSDLKTQIRAAVDKQNSLETDAINVRNRVEELSGSHGSTSTGVAGLGQVAEGVGLGAILFATTLIVGILAAVEIHWRHVDYLDRLLTDVEHKVLTPAEAARLGSSAFSLPSLSGGLVLGAAAVVGLLLFGGRRATPRPRRRVA